MSSPPSEIQTQGSTIIRVDPATVIVFSVLFSPALFASFVMLWKGLQLRDAVLLAAIYCGALYWICSPTVELAPGRLVYRMFLQKRRSVDLQEVRSVRLVSDPAPTLVLRGESEKQPLMSFIVKPFSKAGVAMLLQHIRASNPSARYDQISSDMSTGDFVSVTKRTISFQLRILAVAAIIWGGLLLRHWLSR